jgi:hypothetical protein
MVLFSLVGVNILDGEECHGGVLESLISASEA